MTSIDLKSFELEIAQFSTVEENLQLAVEAGITLEERNKELEILLKNQQNTIDDQELQIVYLKKQTTSLREVNDSSLLVYEQLEVDIQDLERANHRLCLDNNSDKKRIETLLHNVETLESRCDELNKEVDETRLALNSEKLKNERLMQEKNVADTNVNSNKMGYESNTSASGNSSLSLKSPQQRTNANFKGFSGSFNDEISLDLRIVCSRDEIIKLVTEMESTMHAFMAEQERCIELEYQIQAIIEENQLLSRRNAQSDDEEMKSMHDELSILDEVQQSQMCSRCLRVVEDRASFNDEQSSIVPTEKGEDAERSMLSEDAERSMLGKDAERSMLGEDAESSMLGEDAARSMLGVDVKGNDSEHSQPAYSSRVSIRNIFFCKVLIFTILSGLRK